MKRRNKTGGLLSVITLSAIALSVCGCERTSRTDGRSAGGGPGGAESVILLSISPEAPTVSTDIQVVCTCVGDPSTHIQWQLNGRLLEEERDSTLRPRGRFRKGDRISVMISASGASASAMTVIANTPPVTTSVDFQPEVIYRGISITALPAATDADGDEVQFQYQWSLNGQDLPEGGPVLRGDRFSRGDRISLTVTPYDSEEQGRPYPTMPIVVPNGPPRFTSPPAADVRSMSYEYRATAEDPDGDPLTYTLVSGPSGMSIDPQSGVAHLDILKEHAGSHPVAIEVRDPAGAKALQTFTVQLNVP
jgi:hypothetical protein